MPSIGGGSAVRYYTGDLNQFVRMRGEPEGQIAVALAARPARRFGKQPIGVRATKSRPSACGSVSGAIGRHQQLMKAQRSAP